MMKKQYTANNSRNSISHIASFCLFFAFLFLPDHSCGAAETLLPASQPAIADANEKVTASTITGKKEQQGDDYRLLWVILGGSGLLVIFSSIWFTQIKRKNQALAAAKAEADHSKLFKQEFLVNMSHEIRTPMNAIMGLTNLTLNTRLTQRQHDYLRKIDKSAGNLLAIINNLLDYSKIDNGELEIEVISFRLDTVLENLAGMVRLKAEKKGLEIVFKTDQEVPLQLQGDPLRLEQILEYLIDNAIKFTAQGEIVLKVQLGTVNATEKAIENNEQVSLRFSVADTGIGMNAEQQGNLFEAFKQADGSTTRQQGGTGIGLALCRELVLLLDGTITVKSTPGTGSVFSVVIPFATSSNRLPQQTAPDLNGMRALIVDDHPLVRQVMREALEFFSLEVTTVGSGQAALEELKRTRAMGSNYYQLILVDWKMDGMDGIETSRHIRQLDYPQVPTIIMVTAYGRKVVMQQAEQLGIDGFLLKPVSRSLLFDAIMDALTRKERMGNSRVPLTVEPAAVAVSQKYEGTVLMAEDNEINRQVLKELLEQTGLSVVEVVNGMEAVQTMKKQHFDAVFMDIQMPVMDGLEACRLIRTENKDTPVIAITAHTIAEERDRCLAVGMNDHVSKPIQDEKLFAVLDKWLKGIRRVGDAADEPEPLAEKTGQISFPELDGIDVDSALFMMGGNRKLLDKLLRKFTKNHGQTEGELREALATEDYELAYRLAHTVAGVAGTIGAKDFENVARQILQSFKQKQYQQAPALLDALGREQERVVQSLSLLE